MIRPVVLSAIALMFFGGSAVAAGQTSGDQPSSGQPSLVEDFSYPGADKIFEQRGIRLVKGDGKITLVPCGDWNLLEVRQAGAVKDTDTDPGHFCFQVQGSSGYLELEVPNTFQIKGDDHAVVATVKVKDQTNSVPIDKETWTGVGVGAGTNSAVLLALRAS